MSFKADDDEKMIERYLYSELTDAERDRLEERFFLDDELFYAAAAAENDLIDRYAQGRLTTHERTRFEKSLHRFPARREKIANAAVIQTYIAEEQKAADAPIAAAAAPRESFGRKLARLFAFQSPLLGSAMAAVIVLLIVGTGYLLTENRRQSAQLARLQTETDGAEIFRQRESELRGELVNSNQSLNEIRNQAENQSRETDELIKNSAADQQKIRQLERERDDLRRAADRTAPIARSSAPIIASIALAPEKSGGRFNTAAIGEDTKKLAISVTLPENAAGRFSVRLNDQPFAVNVAATNAANGRKIINLSIPAKNLPIGVNRLMIADAAGKEVTTYDFTIEKP